MYSHISEIRNITRDEGKVVLLCGRRNQRIHYSNWSTECFP